VVASIVLGSLSYSKIENRYRNNGKNKINGLKNISSALILTLVTPLVSVVILSQGERNQYWGLERNIRQPEYAGYLDQKCSRDSEMGPPCFYRNAGASRTVLLIGDSHAGHISQAVIDSAKKVKWNTVVWAHSGCPIVFNQSDRNLILDKCIDNNNQMRKYVLETKPDAVIVAQYVRSNSPQKEYRNALSSLQLIVPNLLLIENIPIFPDGKNFMVRKPLVMSPYKPPKEFSRSDMEITDQLASNQLAIWARKNGISTLNFDALFCNLNKCQRYSNAGWLYRDADHFSIAGAALTIPQLFNYLNRL
jgi:hypothetical protein